MWVEYPFQVTFNTSLDLDWTPSLPLETFNCCEFDYSDGVYIVWRPEPATRLWRDVYVGQGKIKPRLSFHRWTKQGATAGDDYLRATWAPVAKADRSGGRGLPGAAPPTGAGQRLAEGCGHLGQST